MCEIISNLRKNINGSGDIVKDLPIMSSGGHFLAEPNN